jgi:hypothetical protein
MSDTLTHSTASGLRQLADQYNALQQSSSCHWVESNSTFNTVIMRILLDSFGISGTFLN